MDAGEKTSKRYLHQCAFLWTALVLTLVAIALSVWVLIAHPTESAAATAVVNSNGGGATNHSSQTTMAAAATVGSASWEHPTVNELTSRTVGHASAADKKSGATGGSQTGAGTGTKQEVSPISLGYLYTRSYY